MEDINVFLARAVELEREAARRYEKLADSMRTDGNAVVEKFFRKMAMFSRKHLALVIERGGFSRVQALVTEEYQWPDGISPEQFDWIGVDCMIDADHALELALDGERRGHAFYADVAATTGDPEVRVMAQEFAAEESEHVTELEKWIGRYAPPADNRRLDPAHNSSGTE